MKAKLITIFYLFAVSSVPFLTAAEPSKAKSGSPAFERMKTLIGSWVGKTDIGQGPVEITVRYRLVAGGSVSRSGSLKGPLTRCHDVLRPGRQTGAHPLLL